MAILGITADGPEPVLAGGGPGRLEPALRRALAALPQTAPVVVLVHGYRWDPALPQHDPHRSLFAPRLRGVRCDRLRSWPEGLGLAGRGTGLAIGFGWPAISPHLPSLWRRGCTGFRDVYERAETAGAALACLIAMIDRIAPGRRVDVLAHSLGARVALAALPRLERAPARIILLGAAEFVSITRERLAAGPAPGPAIYNVTARANDLYDRLFEFFAPAPRPGDFALGAGLPDPPPRWIDIQIDHPEALAWMNARGIPLQPPAARNCHWSFYTQPGAFALYRAILRRRPGWDVASLRAQPALSLHAPRWSRLLPARRAPDAALARAPRGFGDADAAPG
jgi:hypothetical protein